MAKVFGPSSISKSVPISNSSPSQMMSTFGADTDSLMRKMKAQGRVSAEIANAERPSNIWYRFNGQTSFWYMYALMDWYMSEVSVLSTVILRSCTELLRYGLELVPKFAFKCKKCGYESQTWIDECPQCHCKDLRTPDEIQKRYFVRPNGKSFLDDANDNHQSLADVLKTYAISEYLNNQAYMLCVTGDVIDKDDGELLQAYPMEFVAWDPKFVKFLYDDTGKAGTRYAYTKDNRGLLLDLDEDPDAVNMYSEKGKVLYPAYWQVGHNYGGTGEYKLYSEEEVYEDKWFRPSLTYGVPIWYDIEDDLLTYHYIEKHNLKKYKFGYVRKMVILPGFNDEDAEDIAQGVKDVLATNDNSIPIICTPPQMPGVAEQKAQTLELGTESSADLMQIKNDIRDRICAHIGVPNLFAGDVESSGGMNNESQQITTFDRYLMDKYRYLDRLCEWVMGWFPRITDWALVVSRPSKAYSDFRKRMDELQFIQGMKQLGFDIYCMNDQFRYSNEPIDQIQRKQQEEQQQQQAAMAGAMGGMPGGGAPPGMPGGGTGHEELPDKGTSRRDEPDIGASKKEVDQAMEEGQRGMEI